MQQLCTCDHLHIGAAHCSGLPQKASPTINRAALNNQSCMKKTTNKLKAQHSLLYNSAAHKHLLDSHNDGKCLPTTRLSAGTRL